MKSMTGYGSAEGKVGSGRVFVEIRSVNHRYCDILVKMPPKMNPLEPMIKKLIKEKLERGKVDVFMKEREPVSDSKNLKVDLSLAKKYQKCINELGRALGTSTKNMNLFEVMDVREFISMVDIETDYTKYWAQVSKIVQLALKKHEIMRAEEGMFLLRDQKTRLERIYTTVDKIGKLSQESLKKYQVRVRKKLEESVGKRAEVADKVNMEVAMLGEKIDIAEELTRLRSHVSQYRQIIKEADAKGRKLDFLLQEMNREVNTLGSKSGDVSISKHVVNVKSELEKLREQIQNIE